MQLPGDDLLREVQGVVLGDEGEQAPLVHAVVEEELLLVRAARLELPAAVGVAGRDGQRDLGRVDAGAADADPALHEGAEHREEAPVGVVDRREVAPLGGHLGELVEQRGARHPEPVEPDAPVVDAVEAHLVAAVLDAYAVHDRAVAADLDDEGVHPVGLAVDLELGEDGRELGVGGGVADVVLAAGVVGSRDHELLGLRVVARDRAERLHVGPVAGLGHGEAAHRPTGDQVGEVERRGASWCRAGGSRRRTGRTARRPSPAPTGRRRPGSRRLPPRHRCPRRRRTPRGSPCRSGRCPPSVRRRP